MFFEFAGSLLELTLLRTDSSEAERLIVRDRDFAMMWVAGIHPVVLVRVRGLDMQVGAYLAIPQVDSRIEEGNFNG